VKGERREEGEHRRRNGDGSNADDDRNDEPREY